MQGFGFRINFHEKMSTSLPFCFIFFSFILLMPLILLLLFIYYFAYPKINGNI